jgi:hypothetical protein
MDENAIPPGETRPVAWLKANGWVLDRNGIWVDAIQHRMMLAQEDAVQRSLAGRSAEFLRDRPHPRFF